MLPCDSNESIQDVEGNAGDYNNTDAFDGVEDTEFDFVQDVKDTLMNNDSVHEDDNDEETHPEVDMELEDNGDCVPSNQDDVEPSANVTKLVDKPRSALDENQPDHLINTRLPKPSMKYENIPVYNFLPSQAPQRQTYLLFERLFPNSSLGRTDTLRPLHVPSTELVDGVLRKDFGSLYINGLKKRSHYEITVAEFEVYQDEASGQSIKLRIHSDHPTPTVIGEDSYQFILHNGIEHKEMINAFGFEELADDILFTSLGSVPILNSRLNRGVTLGFTPSHCTARNAANGGIAEPLLIHGTMRYAFLFVLTTCLAKSQAKQAGFAAPFSDLSGDFANRRDYATRIHKSNKLENLTIVALILSCLVKGTL
jgi:hypothetical protein